MTRWVTEQLSHRYCLISCTTTAAVAAALRPSPNLADRFRVLRAMRRKKWLALVPVVYTARPATCPPLGAKCTSEPLQALLQLLWVFAR